MPVLDKDGKPIGSLSSMSKADSAMGKLARYGVSMSGDGGLNIPPEALKRIRNDRARRAAISKVPSTPRYIYRDAGGLGVRKGYSRYEVLSLESLRKIREASPVIQPIHSARHGQMRRMGMKWNGRRGEVGWRVVHRDHSSHDAVQPDYIQPYIEQFERVLACPSPDYGIHTTGDLFALLWEDLATINRPTLEIIRSAFDSNRIVQFRPVDGAIIWPTFVWLEKWLQDNPDEIRGWGGNEELSERDALHLISEVVGHDLFQAKYCLVREGTLEAVYTAKDMWVRPIQNRTDIEFAGYPPSYVEQAVELILSFMNAYEMNSSYFTRGMLTEFILGLSGDFHDDDVDAFTDMFREATQGVSRAWQPPIMPLPVDGAISKIDLKNTNKEMQFEIWLSLHLSMITGVYRMDTSTINAKPWDGGQGPKLSEPGRTEEIATSNEEGLQGDLGHIIDNFMTPLAKTCHPDLIVKMEWGNYDANKEAEMHSKQGATSRTRNEIRIEMGDKPLGFWVEPDKYDKLSDEDHEKFHANPWNMPTDQVFQSATQAAQQAQQPEMGPDGQPAGQEQAQQHEAPFGTPPGEDEQPQKPQQATQEAPQEEQQSEPMAKAKAGRITIYVEDVD